MIQTRPRYATRAAPRHRLCSKISSDQHPVCFQLANCTLAGKFGSSAGHPLNPSRLTKPSLCLLLQQPLFHVCGSSAAPPPLFTPLVDNVGAAPAFGEEEPVEEEPAMRLMSHQPPTSNSILGGAERREVRTISSTLLAARQRHFSRLFFGHKLLTST